MSSTYRTNEERDRAISQGMKHMMHSQNLTGERISMANLDRNAASKYLSETLDEINREYCESVLCALKIHTVATIKNTLLSNKLWYYTLPSENIFDLSYEELQWYELIVQYYPKE